MLSLQTENILPKAICIVPERVPRIIIASKNHHFTIMKGDHTMTPSTNRKSGSWNNGSILAHKLCAGKNSTSIFFSPRSFPLPRFS